MMKSRRSSINIFTENQLTDIINKYKSHPSIKKIKSNYTIKQKFLFKPVTVKDIENVIQNIPTKCFKAIRFYLCNVKRLHK